MATTTWAALRANMASLIRGITPADMADVLFERAPRRRRLEEWARVNVVASLRKFDIRPLGKVERPAVHAFQHEQRIRTAQILIAYPLQASRYGAEEIDDLDDVMSADASRIRDTLFLAANYLAGQYAAVPTIGEPRTADPAVWFQPLTVRLIYDEAISAS